MTDAASSRSRPAGARKVSQPGEPPAKSKQLRTTKRKEALRVAEDLFSQRPEWIVFFREILGVDGVVSQLFPTPEERAEFQRSPEYAAVQHMIAELRSQAALRMQLDEREPTRVITVRLPKSVHEALRAEAFSREISMNKLCIAKLLNTLAEETEETEEA
jgi:predicted HicB family RNase H-like nuclease